MEKTETSATPSTSSLKRRNSNDKNTIIEDYQPKKKRESAIRSENNLKMLIQSGQVDTNKQKVSPKKVLSLRKEVRTETLATLIKAQKFDKLAKLYSKTFAAESIENVETSDSETETLPSPDKTRPDSVTPNVPKPTNTTQVETCSILTNMTNVPNPTTTTNVPKPTNTINVPKPTNTANVLMLPNTTKEPNNTNVPNPTNTTNVPESTNVPNQTNITNVLEPTNLAKPTNTTNIPNSKNVSQPTNTKNDPQPLVLESTNTTNESELNNPIDVPNPTITTNLPKPKDTKIVAIATSTTNVPEPTSATMKDTFLHSNNYSTRLKIPLPEALDSVCQITSTNNLDEIKELETESNGSRSSLEAEVLALHKLIRTLASDNSEKGSENPSKVDIKHIEDMYNKVLAVKSKLNGVYREKGEKLRKSFENIQLLVPELKRGLTLPTLQELKERNQPKPLSPRQEQPSLSKESSSHTEISSHQQSSSSESEDSPSKSSNSFPKCTYVAKWTLKHKGPGPGLTEVMDNTGIYIDEHEFIRSQLLATDIRNLARLLLPLIFSEEAMNKCSYTGYGPNGKRPKSVDAAPGLDEHARNVLMAFVIQYAKKSGWTIVSPYVMNQSMRDKLRKFQLRNLTWKRVNDP